MMPLSCFLLAISACCSCDATAKLALESRQLDFGVIEALQDCSNELRLHNIGDTQLLVYRVRACCGATANITTNSIAPGAAATLTVSLKPMAKPGPFRKKVTLTTNDPSAPVVEIPIFGEVMAPNVEVIGDEVVVATKASWNDSGESSGEGLRAESGGGTQFYVDAGVEGDVKLTHVLE